MKEKTIFFILLLTLLGCENNSKEILPCNIMVNNGLSYVNDKLYSGTCNRVYNDTLLLTTETYKRGKKVEEIGYYNDGSIEYIGKEKEGIPNGDFVSYYPNGQVSIIGELEMGEFVKDWKYYDYDGSLNKTLKYNRNGEMIDSIYHKNQNYEKDYNNIDYLFIY